MLKFYKTDTSEQETTINIEYSESYASIYTSKKSIYEKLHKLLGEPTETYYIQDMITGAKWVIPFSDKANLRSCITRKFLIGGNT